MVDIDVKDLTDADLKALTQKCEEEKKNREAQRWIAICQAWNEYVAKYEDICINRDKVTVRPEAPGRIFYV